MESYTIYKKKYFMKMGLINKIPSNCGDINNIYSKINEQEELIFKLKN
jgi:hypothetical protein